MGSDRRDGRSDAFQRVIRARKARALRQTSAAVKRSSKFARFTSWLLVIGLLFVLAGMVYLLNAYSLVKANISQLVNIQLPQGSQATRVYARDYDPKTGRGTLLATLYLENRQHANYSEIPPELIAVFLSTEDGSFYRHGGIDFRGNVRALLNILRRRGEVRGGASTITQQLARNVFLPYIKSQKTLNRKVQEMILSGALEKQFSKQQILESYMNHIFLGHGAYGVRAAAQTYFGKDLDELTLDECALLAGLPQLPSRYDPYNHPEAAEARRKDVLKLLERRLNSNFFQELVEADPEKFSKLNISKEDISEAMSRQPTLGRAEEGGSLRAPYFTAYLRDHILYPKFGADQVLRQGMIIVTTIDPEYQKAAEEILSAEIDKQRKSQRVSQGALVLMEAQTGEVLACVGGYKWGQPNAKGEPDKFNRAMQARRQTGSSFKPFTYATAYEQGFPPGILVFDGPNKEVTEQTGKRWPNNSDHTYKGWMSMFAALQHSRNAAAVDVMNNLTGIPAVIQTARNMGLTSVELPEVPALTLGIADVKPVEMAEAYTTFPNMGRHVKRTLIKRIYNQNGILMESDDNSSAISKRSNQALSQRTAWIMVQNMRLVVNAGTGTRARVPDVEIAGKTGTCDDFRDAWFCGYSPELVCTVWVGNDDHAKAMSRMFGGGLPAIIFQKVMNRVYHGPGKAKADKAEDAAAAAPAYTCRYKVLKFSKPEGVDFGGFPRAQYSGGIESDEELAAKKAEEEAKKKAEDGNSDGATDQDQNNDDSGFYQPFEPPPGEPGTF